MPGSSPTNHAVSNITTQDFNNSTRFAMQYDAAGNMSLKYDYQKSLTKEMLYDGNNRIRIAKDHDTGQTLGRYYYDDQGFRVRKIALREIDGEARNVEVLYPSMYFGIEQHRTLEGDKIENTEYSVNNVYLNGVRIAAVIPSGAARYYLTDQVDSVKVVADDEGNAVARFEYLPYGEAWFQEGEENYSPKYNSQELDKETNFYFFNARHYDPEIGRFVTADNVIAGVYDTQGWNRYAYVKNNPVRYSDPTGHEPDATDEYGQHFSDEEELTYNDGGREAANNSSVGKKNDVGTANKVEEQVQKSKNQNQVNESSSNRYNGKYYFGEHAPPGQGPMLSSGNYHIPISATPDEMVNIAKGQVKERAKRGLSFWAGNEERRFSHDYYHPKRRTPFIAFSVGVDISASWFFMSAGGALEEVIFLDTETGETRSKLYFVNKTGVGLASYGKTYESTNSSRVLDPKNGFSMPGVYTSVAYCERSKVKNNFNIAIDDFAGPFNVTDIGPFGIFESPNGSWKGGSLDTSLISFGSGQYHYTEIEPLSEK